MCHLSRTVRSFWRCAGGREEDASLSLNSCGLSEQQQQQHQQQQYLHQYMLPVQKYWPELLALVWQLLQFCNDWKRRSLLSKSLSHSSSAAGRAAVDDDDDENAFTQPAADFGRSNTGDAAALAAAEAAAAAAAVDDDASIAAIFSLMTSILYLAQDEQGNCLHNERDFRFRS
jgi:hypothetical protein